MDYVLASALRCTSIVLCVIWCQKASAAREVRIPASKYRLPARSWRFRPTITELTSNLESPPPHPLYRDLSQRKVTQGPSVAMALPKYPASVACLDLSGPCVQNDARTCASWIAECSSTFRLMQLTIRRSQVAFMFQLLFV